MAVKAIPRSSPERKSFKRAERCITRRDTNHCPSDRKAEEKRDGHGESSAEKFAKEQVSTQDARGQDQAERAIFPFAHDQVVSHEQSEQWHQILDEVEQAHGGSLVSLHADVSDLDQAEHAGERYHGQPNENARNNPAAAQSIAEFLQPNDQDGFHAVTSSTVRLRAIA